MSDYARIKEAISHYELLCRSEHGVNFVNTTAVQFADLQAKYYSKTENPDYSSNIKKFCYLYKYSVSHGYYIFTVLRRLRPKIKPSIFSRNPTKIACVGGGPGTEIIGLCRYLRTIEPENLSNSVEITIFDKEPSWKESCDRILRCLKGELRIKIKFVEFDATDPQTYQKLDFSKFVMVMSNFFLSEIRKAKIVGASNNFWKHLFNSMGTGKIFVAVDFADNEGQGWAHLEGILPINHSPLLSDVALPMSCPDSKECIQDLENELDHRPKKNATNFVKAILT